MSSDTMGRLASRQLSTITRNSLCRKTEQAEQIELLNKSPVERTIQSTQPGQLTQISKPQVTYGFLKEYKNEKKLACFMQ
ncbi:MAG: hypothetical protein AB2535_11565 [Candidatus Thiodiazotropha endolucinida]